MPYNLLIFPLVGGYYFITHVWFLKFYNQRIDRQRLIFNSILCGIFLFIMSFLIAGILSTWKPELVTFVKSFYPFEIDYLGTAIISLFIGVVCPLLINLFLDEEKFIKKAINKIGDDFEKLVLKSWDENKYICLTLTNQKVYVGVPTSIPLPGSGHIRLLPFYSGYRDESHHIILDTHYIDVYLDIDTFKNIEELDFEVIMKSSDVLSSRLYNEDVFSYMTDQGKRKKSKK